MPETESEQSLQELCSRIQECIAPFAGRVEYGNLRCKISRWDCDASDAVTNVALVYETPGGSTDQINVGFHHDAQIFTVIDAHLGELTFKSVDEVLERVRPRVECIPGRRRETLFDEIRRQLDSGTNTAGVVGHLNRMMQSSLVGGSITHLELRDGMTFAVQYLKSRSSEPTSAADAG